jgi:hypothetical protein
MKIEDLYSSAHVFVAGIRIFEHLHSKQPSVEELCDLLKLSAEQGHFISKKLTARGVIEQIESGYGTRLFIKDHLKIEDIPSDQQESSLADELKEFQSSKKEFSKEIESFQAEQAKKKKSMFAELEKKLKKELDTE